MLAAAAAQAAAPAGLGVIANNDPALATSTSPPNLSRPLRPRDERKWAMSILREYPSAAKRRGLSGTVALTVQVSFLGRPESCDVTQSSGHEMLDKAACKGMLRHARFDPALDSSGQPAAGQFSTKISYLNR